jgi:HPt (histidine-containing phosphotransfer) domain-containing protein
MGKLDGENPEIDVSDINIPGVDAGLGSSLYGGEMDIYMAVLRSFTANIPETINKLKNVSEETLPQYATVVHGLKGSCASIAAELIKEKAYDLEKKAKAGDLGGVLAQNETLLKETEQLVKDILAWLDRVN